MQGTLSGILSAEAQLAIENKSAQRTLESIVADFEAPLWVPVRLWQDDLAPGDSSPPLWRSITWMLPRVEQFEIVNQLSRT